MTTTVTSSIGDSKDYADLSTWFAAKQADITAAGSDQIQIAELWDDFSSGWLDETLSLTGATTDATHYYKVTTHSGERGNGYSTGPRLGSSSLAYAIADTQAGTVVDSVDFVGNSYTSANNSAVKYNDVSSAKRYLINCRAFGFNRTVYYIDGLSSDTDTVNNVGDNKQNNQSIFYFYS